MKKPVSRTVRWLTAATLLLFLLLAVGGCRGREVVRGPVGLTTYQTLVRRYNRNLSGVDRLWTRAVVEIKWQDDEGNHFEQGEGNLILVMPDRLALSIGKLGHTLFWAGCDPRWYWLFDLRDKRVLYVGRHGGWAERTPPRGFVLPIHPLDLIRLLGVIPLDPTQEPPEPQVERHQNRYLIEPPGTGTRVLIEPSTARPVRIDLLDADGRSRVIGRLSRWRPMTREGVSPGDYPWVATRLEVSLTDRLGTMTLFLSDPSDGRAYDRIKEQAFNLDHLRGVFQAEKTIDLDEPAQPDHGPDG